MKLMIEEYTLYMLRSLRLSTLMSSCSEQFGHVQDPRGFNSIQVQNEKCRCNAGHLFKTFAQMVLSGNLVGKTASNEPQSLPLTRSVKDDFASFSDSIHLFKAYQTDLVIAGLRIYVLYIKIFKVFLEKDPLAVPSGVNLLRRGRKRIRLNLFLFSVV